MGKANLSGRLRARKFHFIKLWKVISIQFVSQAIGPIAAIRRWSGDYASSLKALMVYANILVFFAIVAQGPKIIN